MKASLTPRGNGGGAAALVAAAAPEGRMKPVNLVATLAAAETELACLKMALAQVKEDREELRQERDEWRREAEAHGGGGSRAERRRARPARFLEPFLPRRRSGHLTNSLGHEKHREAEAEYQHRRLPGPKQLRAFRTPRSLIAAPVSDDAG
jgi:hypothetical protein